MNAPIHEEQYENPKYIQKSNSRSMVDNKAKE